MHHHFIKCQGTKISKVESHNMNLFTIFVYRGAFDALVMVYFVLCNFLAFVTRQALSLPHCAKVQKYEAGKIGLQFFDMWC